MKEVIRVTLVVLIVFFALSCTTKSEEPPSDGDGDVVDEEIFDGGEDISMQEGDAVDGSGDQEPDQDAQEQDGDVVSEEEEEEPVCGNGTLERGEFCDDGHTTACGPCNEDCTAAGEGSVCGDGTVCPDTEFCDDGGTDDCFACNADCTGPGNGTTCGSPHWSQQFGDTNIQLGLSIATDNSNNVLATGYFGGTVNFGSVPITSAGGNDIFVAKYNGSGSHMWSYGFGDASNQFGRGIATDSSGNVLVTGYFGGAVNFGGGTRASAGGYDIFVAKFDAAGNHLWSSRFGDASDQFGYAIATDSSENVFVTGYFQGTVDFGGGTLTSAGNYDIFIVKLDASGNHLWSRRFGDASLQGGFAIATDYSLQVLVTGYFAGAVDFGGGTLTSAGGYDIFVAKFDAAGNHLWSSRFGDGDDQLGYGIAADGSRNVLVTGSFGGTVDFGGGPLTSAGNMDIFAAKFNSSGVHVWSRRFGDTGDQIGNSIAADVAGDVLVAGSFGGTVDFGGGPLMSAGSQDIFVAKLDGLGSHLWSRRFGDTAAQYCEAVVTDSARNVLITGYFEGTVDFGGGPFTSAGYEDIFMAKLGP